MSVYAVTLTSYDNTLTLQTHISSLHIHTDTSSLHDDISLIGRLQYAVALKLGSWFGKTRGYYDEESIELKWSYSTINLRLLPYIKIYNI